MTGTASELYHQTMISVGMLPTLLRWRCCSDQWWSTHGRLLYLKAIVDIHQVWWSQCLMCSKHIWKIWIRRRSIRISRRRQPARHVRHMTAAAASCHRHATLICMLRPGAVWTVRRYVSTPTISVYLADMLWTMVVVKNETSPSLMSVHRTVLVFTLQRGTRLLHGLNAHRHRDEA